jgi:hypothetical protein
MSRVAHYWEKMYAALTAFCRTTGHCDVPTNYAPNPALGRWVAVQRFRRKKGLLTEEQIALLDRLGFIWSPGEHSWEQCFRELAAFREQHGHCRVPVQDPRYRRLCAWIANQRHRKKIGKLSPERIARLDSLGFRWNIYGVKSRRRPSADVSATESETISKARRRAHVVEHRLYQLGPEHYVQYDGQGPMPPELTQHLKKHDGEYPPFLLLPNEPVRFVLAINGFGRERIVRWNGKGPLPEDVMDYVRENGCLPPRR